MSELSMVDRWNLMEIDEELVFWNVALFAICFTLTFLLVEHAAFIYGGVNLDRLIHVNVGWLLLTTTVLFLTLKVMFKIQRQCEILEGGVYR